jgi:hypothetical protein
VISPICWRSSRHAGASDARIVAELSDGTDTLSPDQLHDHGEQPEVTGGLRALPLIETGAAKAERREADDSNCLLRLAVDEREKTTERKQQGVRERARF